MDATTLAFVARVAKQAADAARRQTGRTETVPAGGEAGREAVRQALAAGLKPAAHTAPTRYGRKPYQRTAP